jgi:hypothetical protein
MVYIGHFSFDEIGAQNEVRHGYFSSVVEADNAEAAANEFKELIFSLRKMDDIFGRIVAVYMEDIVELRNIPKRAIVTRIQSSAGEFPKSISKSLPHVVTPGINVYALTSEVDADGTDRGSDEYKPAEPFIKL